MALKGFMAKGERGIETATETSRAVRTEASAPRTLSTSTRVDASSEFEGKLRCTDTLRIDGYIKGEVDCEATVVVGEGAKVHASVAAEEVQVAGLVNGNIAARRKITLARTAVVTGDLTTPGIVIEEGAKLNGRIVIGSDAESVQESEPAKEAQKAKAARKTPVSGTNPHQAPAPQPVSASA